MINHLTKLVGTIALCLTFVGSANAEEVCWPSGFTPQPSEISTIPRAEDLKVGTIHIYLDASASMGGFVTPPKNSSDAIWIMNALIQSLPTIARSVGGAALFYRSGDGRANDSTNIDKPMSEQQLKEAVRPGWYNGIDAPLDLPLTQALLRKNDDVTILITDLFLSDSSLAGEPYYALKRPLDIALRSGKAIGILGIRHSFNGAIYDLPGKPANFVYNDAHARPLMLVMIGSSARVLAIKARIDSEFLRERSEESRFVLFTSDSSLGFKGVDFWGDRYIAAGDSVTNSRGFGVNLDGASVPQIEFSRKQREVIGELDFSNLWLKGALRPGETRIESRMWWLEKPSAKRCEDRWDGPLDLQVQPLRISLNDALTAKIEILPSEMRDDIVNGKYLIVSRVISTGFQLDPTATWLSEWGFEPQSADALLAKKPKFFPVLNLSRLGRALRDVLNESTQPNTVAEIAMGIQLKR